MAREILQEKSCVLIYSSLIIRAKLAVYVDVTRSKNEARDG